MKFNKWTMGLAAVGVVSLASAARADEKMSVVNTALTGTTLSGYVDTSIQWNPGTGNGQIAPVAFQNSTKADGFNLNVVDLALDKPLSEDSWAAGYHVEMWMGPDANTLATLSNPFSNPNHYASGSFPGPSYEAYYVGTGGSDFAIRQAYLSLRTPIANAAIDWKLGVFDSPLGYESTSSPVNPNYTHSFGYTMEPTELTGLMATYKLNDSVTFQAGIANTPGAMINERPFISYADETQSRVETMKTYFGAVTLTAPDNWGWAKGSMLTAGVLNGFAPSQTWYGGTQTSWYLGATVPMPVTGLKVGAALDYLNVGATDYGDGDYNYHMWAVAAYANYKVNDKLSVAGRFDHAQSGGYTEGALDSLTADVQYNMWANVISRLEVRWDHTEHGKMFGGTNPYYYTSSGYYEGGGNYAYADEGGLKENAFTLALNLIYQF